MGHLACEETLRKQDLFRMKKKQLQRDLMAAFQDLWVGFQENGARFLTVVCGMKTLTMVTNCKKKGSWT